MPRKIKSEPEPEPEVTEEVETVETQETKEEEEDKPITKPKRVLTEKQLESLKKAGEAAALKKTRIKRTSAKI
jgi:predicted DNA binding protein